MRGVESTAGAHQRRLLAEGLGHPAAVNGCELGAVGRCVPPAAHVNQPKVYTGAMQPTHARHNYALYASGAMRRLRGSLSWYHSSAPSASGSADSTLGHPSLYGSHQTSGTYKAVCLGSGQKCTNIITQGEAKNKAVCKSYL